MRLYLKGISPLVAAVMLIAVTMTIAGILAFWASSFTTRQTSTLSNQTQQITTCAGANFKVFTSFYDSDKKEHTIMLENKGLSPVDIVGVDYIYKNGITHKNASLHLPVTSEIKVLIVEDVEDNFVSFRVISNCPNVYAEGSYPG